MFELVLRLQLMRNLKFSLLHQLDSKYVKDSELKNINDIEKRIEKGTDTKDDRKILYDILMRDPKIKGTYPR